MLRKKTLLKASFAEQMNHVRDSDIINLYKKHNKEGNEKQRRILEIQRLAARKNDTRHEHTRRPRVNNRILLPPIASDTRRKKESKGVSGKQQQQLTNGLPSIKTDKNERQPVLDPRFHSLLSSLIEVSKPFGQVQRFAPPRRLTYSTLQK